MRRSARSRLLLAGCLALAASSCGGGREAPPPPPVVDLLRQVPAADEVVHAGRLAAELRALSGADPSAFLAARLRELGFAPGGPNGAWRQPFERVTRVARPQAPLVLQNGERRVSLAAGSDFVAALGTDASAARAGGTELLFVHGGMEPPAGSPSADRQPPPSAGAATRERGAQPGAAPAPVPPAPPTAPGRTFVAFAPWPAAGQTPEAALGALLRRAATRGAAALLVLPRPGTGATLPPPREAARLAAGSGLPLAVWLSEPAARAALMGLTGTGLEGFTRLEGRSDVLPLAIGRVGQLRVAAVEERDRRHNVVGVLPHRSGGTEGEVVALVAPLPVTRAAGPEPAGPHPWGDRRGQVAAAAELLSALAALRTLSDAPRRDVVVAFVDPGEDGLEGTRRLIADPQFAPERLAAALVVLAGNLGGPGREVTLVGLQASPLAAQATRAAASYGRQARPDAAPWRGTMWSSPAWAFLQAGVPSLLVEPGAPSAPPAAPAAAATARAGQRASARVAPTPPRPRAGSMADGLIADARLLLRLTLELSEAPRRPERADPRRVEQQLREPPPPAPVPPAPRVASRRGSGVAPIVPAPAGETAVAQGTAPPVSQSPAPEATLAPAAPEAGEPPEPPASVEPPSPEAPAPQPAPTPPQR